MLHNFYGCNLVKEICDFNGASWKHKGKIKYIYLNCMLQFFSVALAHFSNHFKNVVNIVCISQKNSHKLHKIMDFVQKRVTCYKSLLSNFFLWWMNMSVPSKWRVLASLFIHVINISRVHNYIFQYIQMWTVNEEVLLKDFFNFKSMKLHICVF